MAEVRITKTKEGVLLSGELLPEIAGLGAAEIFPLRDGAFIFLPLKLLGRRAAQGGLSQEERAVVEKLLTIKFEKRTQGEVDRLFSGEENAVLSSLLSKGVVTFFRKGKYEKDGVYNVTDAAYHRLRDGGGKEQTAQAPLASAAPSSATPPRFHPSSQAQGRRPPPLLEKQGWMALDGEADARNFTLTYGELVKNGDVKGVRAFDRKYYVITRAFFEKWEGAVVGSLEKKEKAAEEVAKETGIDAGGCAAILAHLCEEGEAMEKHRGKFVRA